MCGWREGPAFLRSKFGNVWFINITYFVCTAFKRGRLIVFKSAWRGNRILGNCWSWKPLVLLVPYVPRQVQSDRMLLCRLELNATFAIITIWNLIQIDGFDVNVGRKEEKTRIIKIIRIPVTSSAQSNCVAWVTFGQNINESISKSGHKLEMYVVRRCPC